MGCLVLQERAVPSSNIEECWQAPSDVLTAKVTLSEKDSVGKEPIPIDDDYTALAQLLQNLESHPLVEQQNLIIDYDNLWGPRLASGGTYSHRE